MMTDIQLKRLDELETLSAALDESAQRVMDYSERAAQESTKFLQHMYSDKARQHLEKARVSHQKIEAYLSEHFGIEESNLNHAVAHIQKSIENESILERIATLILRASRRLAIYQAKVHPHMIKLEGDLRYVFHNDDIQRLRQDFSQLRSLLPEPNQPTQKRMVEFEKSLIAREKYLMDPKNSQQVAKDLKEMKSGLLQQIRSIRSLVNQADAHMKEDVSSVLKLQQARFEKLEKIPMAQIVQGVGSEVVLPVRRSVMPA